jgi:hypothetical protein
VLFMKRREYVVHVWFVLLTGILDELGQSRCRFTVSPVDLAVRSIFSFMTKTETLVRWLQPNAAD